MTKLSKVTKSNELIQMPHFIDGLEQKLFARMVIEIRDKPNQDSYAIPIGALVNDLDHEMSNAIYVKKAVGRMFNPLEVEDDIRIRYIPVFEEGELNKETGTVHFKPSEELRPHILNLVGSFTSYNLESILGLRSGYSVKIYELFVSNSFKSNPVIFTVDELRECLGLGKRKYKDYNMFKKKTILVAQKALLETDINFTFEELKNGRKVMALSFTITSVKNEGIKTKVPTVECVQSNSLVDKIAVFCGVSTKQALKIYEYALSTEDGSVERAEERIIRNLKHTEKTEQKNKIDTTRIQFFNSSLKDDWALTIEKQEQTKKDTITKNIAKENEKRALKASESQREALEGSKREKEKQEWANRFKELSDSSKEILKEFINSDNQSDLFRPVIAGDYRKLAEDGRLIMGGNEIIGIKDTLF